MVIPMGDLSKVQDFYTRDHGTPREDAVYDGTDSLTAAVASEDPTTGIVTAVFRKPLIGILKYAYSDIVNIRMPYFSE